VATYVSNEAAVTKMFNDIVKIKADAGLISVTTMQKVADT